MPTTMLVDSLGNEFGKLFIGGLHQTTTNNSLKAYFSQFGVIEESIVRMDNLTGRSRGFGYVKFKEDASVDSVLAHKLHLIDQKLVDAKRCNVNMKGKNRRSLKVFVGGISLEHNEDTLHNFFSKYGRVTEVNLLINPDEQRHRGFAFVGFDDEEVVKVLIRLHYLNIGGKKVEIKAMKPPLSQRSALTAISRSRSVRPVLAACEKYFAPIQAYDYLRWTTMGATGWNSFINGLPPWTTALNQHANGTTLGERALSDYTLVGNQLGLVNPNGFATWPVSSSAVFSGDTWISTPGKQLSNSSATDPTVTFVSKDFPSYNPQTTQLQPQESRPSGDLHCYGQLSSHAFNPSNLFAPLQMWNAPATTQVCYPPQETKWNYTASDRILAPTWNAAATLKPLDPTEMLNNSYTTANLTTLPRTDCEQNSDEAIASWLAAVTLGASNLNRNANPWAAAANATAVDL